MALSIDHPAVQFAKKCIRKNSPAPKYVRLQCKDFLKIANGRNKKYGIDEKIVKKIEAVLKLMIMPKGLKAGQTMYECAEGYQWLLYIATLAVVHAKDHSKRRYETVLLEIARKNYKTYTVATLFILLFILEPPLSKFFSVAPDGALSREVKEAVQDTLRMSPLLYEYMGEKRFKILRDYIEFVPNKSRYIPLNYSNSRMDGRLPNVFLADEVGGLPNSYAIEAMRSGQLNILNKLGFIISTKYPTVDNPFEDEVKYAKKVLDGLTKDEKIFALLFEPDDTEHWETDDKILKQSNPVAWNNKTIWKDLLYKRDRAIEMESARENFLTKHCNIIYAGAGSETYIDVKYVQKCKVADIDWTGREVWVGVDLSLSNDNTSVSFVSEEDGVVLAESIAFIPEDRIEEKNKYEKIDYRRFIKDGKCIACGDLIIDYAVVEQFVFDLEKNYGVKVVAIGFDRWNAISSAQKWDEKYNTVEIKQHSSVLHPPTKLLYEQIMGGRFQYTENKLLEINFQNAKCTFDTNKNRYVNKKKSNGKVDMVISLINAMYLLQQDRLINQMSFVSQVV